MHRHVHDHDDQLQKNLAVIGYRSVEAQHVLVEWADGPPCRSLGGSQKG